MYGLLLKSAHYPPVYAPLDDPCRPAIGAHAARQSADLIVPLERFTGRFLPWNSRHRDLRFPHATARRSGEARGHAGKQWTGSNSRRLSHAPPTALWCRKRLIRKKISRSLAEQTRIYLDAACALSFREHHIQGVSIGDVLERNEIGAGLSREVAHELVRTRDASFRVQRFPCDRPIDHLLSPAWCDSPLAAKHARNNLLYVSEGRNCHSTASWLAARALGISDANAVLTAVLDS